MPDYNPLQNRKDSELTYRMSLLPFGTYSNPDGGNDTLGFAVPGAIQEPVNALMRLFGSGNFAKGPDYPGNADDMRTLLFSMYGGNALNPGKLLEGAAARAEAAPVRMYHGTASPDDFSTFRPSENGAFGPGVYLSREAESTNPYAFNGPNPRVMPVDVSGPLATYDDYLAARNASPDQAATIQALLDRGFSGVSVDNATPKGSVNVTNVFRPGSVTSPLTGETLFSDGLPSLWGNALAPSQEPRNALMDYAQNDQSHMWDHRDQPPVEDYQSVLPSDMNQFRLNWMRQYRSSHPGSGPEDAYDAYLKSPEYKEKLKGSKHIPFDQIPPGEFIPHR